MNEQNKYLDFDAAWAEKNNKPLILRIFGRDEELPASLPAATVLRMMRLNKANQLTQLSTNESMELGVSIFGEERVNRWSNENGMDIMQFASLLGMVIGLYTRPAAAENDTGVVVPVSKKK